MQLPSMPTIPGIASYKNNSIGLVNFWVACHMFIKQELMFTDYTGHHQLRTSPTYDLLTL